jgi:hypothetical protein
MSVEYIASLNRKEYENEAKFDALSNAAIKRQPLQIDFKIPKHVNEDKMVTRDDVADISLRDLAIDNQLAKISTASIPDLPIKQKPVISEVTAEMIADYQAEQNKPFVIDGKSYAYHPIELDTDVEPLPPLPDMSRLDDLDSTIKNSIERIDFLNARIKQIDKYLIDLDKVYSKGLAEIFRDKENFLLTENEARQKQRQYREDYNTKKQNALQQRDEADRIIQNYSSMVDRATLDKEQLQEDYSYIQAERAKIENDNQDKLDEATRAFNVLNRGRASVQRLPGETQEEYAVRLRETGNAPEIPQEELIQRADLYETKKLINNLKTILKPEQASNIAKLSVAEEKYQMNKFFPKIKKAYEKTYNKSVRVPDQELLDFFLDEISYEDKPLIAVPTAFSGFDEPGFNEPVPNLFETQQFEAQQFEEPPYTRLPAPRKPRVPRPPRNLEITPEDIGASRELTRQYREVEGEIPVAEGRIIAPSASSLTVPQMREYLAANHPNAVGFKEAMKSDTRRARVEQIYKEAVGEAKPSYRPLEFPLSKGKGIHTKSLPKKAHFGKVSINPHNLYHKNLLQVRNLKGQSIGVSDIKVSDGMSEMLLKMLEGVNPTKKDFAILEKNEPSLYNNLIHLAQLHKDYETPNNNETKQQMKHRMELVQGEIEAGNTAPSILSEAKQLLRLMVGNGMLKSTQARKHYDYLKNYN